MSCGRDELAFLDIHDLAGAAGRDQQIGLPAKESRDLQDVDGFGRGLRLRRLVNVGQHLEAQLARGRARMRKPSSKPGPRYEFTLLRLALSKEALKTKSPAILPDLARQKVNVLFALDHARSGDQAQAACRPPKLNRHADTAAHAMLGDVHAAQLPVAMLQRRADEGAEQRMRLQRLRFELGMELAAEIPGMIGDLADLDVHAVRSLAREPQAVRGENRLRTRG